ncbi:MAG: hypothetical protein GWP91_07820 [Rhodobacterales bacterium]|nr:hypothetical protein [Rhodobacterales bacterium]
MSELTQELGQCGQGAIWLTQGDQLTSIGPKQSNYVADLDGLASPTLLCSAWGTKLTGVRDGQQVVMNLKGRDVVGEETYPTSWTNAQLSPSGSWMVVNPTVFDGEEAALQWVDLTNLEAVDLQRGGDDIEAAWMADADTLVTAASYWGEERGVALTVWWPNDAIDAPGWEVWIDDLTVGAEDQGNAGIQSSPDGRFAAVSLVDGTGRSKLVVMDLQEQGTQTYLDVRGAVSWSPDSTRLLGWRRTGQSMGAATDIVEVNVVEKERRATRWDRGPLTWLLPNMSAPRILWLDDDRALIASNLGDQAVAVLEDGVFDTISGARLNLAQTARTSDGALWTLGAGRLWRVGLKGRARIFDLGIRAKQITVNNDGHLVIADGRRTVAVVFDADDKKWVRTVGL